MAILKRKKNTTEAVAPKKEKKGEVSEHSRDLSGILIRPRITEKAGIMAESSNVYIFDVHENATKHTIAHAITELYKVTPEKVAIVPVPSKQVFVRGKFGTKKGGKKAYVYLKKGDKIEIM